MAGLLRVLLIDDSDDDAQLIVRELRRGGYDVEYERVETRTAMEEVLSHRVWDIILCDYNMPLFNALDALESVFETDDARLHLNALVSLCAIDHPQRTKVFAAALKATYRKPRVKDGSHPRA